MHTFETLSPLFNEYPSGKMVEIIEGQVLAEVMMLQLPEDKVAGYYVLLPGIDTYPTCKLTPLDEGIIDKEPNWEFVMPTGKVVELDSKTVYYAKDTFEPDTLYTRGFK